MCPSPPGLGAVGYTSLYREYLRRVDACLSSRVVLGVDRYVGCGCGYSCGRIGIPHYVAKVCEKSRLEVEAGSGESGGDVRGACVISGDEVGAGVSEKGLLSGVGATSCGCGCGGSGSVDAGVDSVRCLAGGKLADSDVSGARVADVPVVGKRHNQNVKKRLRLRARKVVGDVVAKESLGSGIKVGVSYAGAVKQSVGYEALGSVAGTGYGTAISPEEGVSLNRQRFEREKVENELAIQRGKYNVKRNEFLNRSRISEKRWEHERLTCEQKLANITEARFGSKPGYAETLASLSDGSELPPSLSTGSDSPANLSDGTISPNSSMSVAEANRLVKKVEELSGEVSQLKLERVALNAALESSGKIRIEDGRVHRYDGSGQYIPPSPKCLSEDCAGSMGDYPEELQYYSGSVY